MHFSNEYLHNAQQSLNPKSPQNRLDNVHNLPILHHIATEMAAKESVESEYFDRIIDTLIELLKLHQTNDIVCRQVIELVTIFQRAIQTKAKIFQQLKRILMMIRTLKTIPNGIINRLHSQFVCIERFTSCMDLDIVAKKLASPKVCI